MRVSEEYPHEDFAFVLIPSDASKPLAQLSCQAPQNQTGDLLVDHLKGFFAQGGGDVDISLLEQQATQTLSGTADTPSVSSDTLSKVAKEASVETFTLVHGTPSNRFTEILMYLDEVGMLKRLTLNTRASQYAKAAGFDPPPQFYGDVYIGRLERKPSIRNTDFLLGSDTAMDAPWLRSATMENLEHQAEMNQITGRFESQPTVDGFEAPKQEVGFNWTQTEEEIEMVLPLNDGQTSKDIKVSFNSQVIRITISGTEVITCSLFERVDVDGCTWTIETGTTRTLVVSMEKAEAALWPRLKD